MHRNWLVNVTHVKGLERDGSETRLFVGEALAPHGRGVRVPVARERVQHTLLADATGLRR